MVAKGDPCRFTLNFAPLVVRLSLLTSLTFLPLVSTFNVDTRDPFIISGPNGSYFGYALALYQNKMQQQNPMLIVGAPRFTEQYTHGKIYSCSVHKNNTCNPIDVDYGNRYQYNKINYWFGGTIDTNEEKNRLIVCAHRYTVLLTRSVRTMGICIEMLDPLGRQIRKLECKGEQKKNHVFFYGFAQFGSSMRFSKDNSTLLIGIPGLYQGKGGFVSYSENECDIIDYSDETKHIVHTDDAYEYQMVGYSITSGRYFDNQVYTVVGAPGISTSGSGKIYFYAGDVLFQYYKGTQFGSGFGSSLLSADVTGDGKDDLIVGAPYQYSKRNEGSIHVFISTGPGFFERSELVGDNVINAHFGLALGNLGDINKDGFGDIVVGAPYEEDCGAIYIYMGNPVKLSENNRQKILGKTLNSNLKGFGISFSKPMDIDGNGYDDFLVGAFLSDQAVLLYSREIKAESNITSNPKELDPTNTKCFGEVFVSGCLSLKMCIKLTGKKDIKTIINIGVDVGQETKKRVTLEGSNNRELFLRSQEEQCISMNLKTRKTNNIFSPVIMEFRVVYSLNDTCPTCTQNLLDTTVLSKEIPFVTECGADKICYSELVTNLQIVEPQTNNILYIGDSSTFRVRVTVRNAGEPAYQPVGVLKYPLYLQYIPNTATNGVNCSAETILPSGKEQNNVVTCNLKNPIRREDFSYNMTFEINKEHLKFGSFPMKFSVTSQSEELCSENDAVELTVKMRKKAKLKVNPSSEPQFIVVSDKRNKSSEIQLVVHKYFFYNIGPSDLKNILFSVSVRNVFQKIKGKSKRIIVEADLETTQKQSLPLVICHRVGKNEKEYNFQCNARNFSNALSFNLEIKLKLFTRFIASDLQPVISNITIPKYEDEQYVSGVQNYEISCQVITKLRPDRKPVKIWIIVVCVVLGIFLLGLIIFCLWKCGFFKRQKVHRVGREGGNMRQLSQPDPDEDKQ